MSVMFKRVKRPIEDPYSNKGGQQRGGLSEAIRQTFTAGDAVRVPVHGEATLVVQNRARSTACHAARLLDVRARVRTRQIEDGAAVLVWLEPKESA